MGEVSGGDGGGRSEKAASSAWPLRTRTKGTYVHRLALETPIDRDHWEPVGCGAVGTRGVGRRGRIGPQRPPTFRVVHFVGYTLDAHVDCLEGASVQKGIVIDWARSGLHCRNQGRS
jgi:hypothetical protein